MCLSEAGCVSRKTSSTARTGRAGRTTQGLGKHAKGFGWGPVGGSPGRSSAEERGDGAPSRLQDEVGCRGGKEWEKQAHLDGGGQGCAGVKGPGPGKLGMDWTPP